LMILIYQQSNNNGIREFICKFNLFHYGTLFLVYPLLLVTNLRWPLFLLMSCIYFPQIYTNGLGGFRPEISSPYYTRYLLSRMLIIVLCLPFRSICVASRSTSSTFSPITFSLQFASFSSPFRYPSSYPVRPTLHTKKIRLQEGNPKVFTGTSLQLQALGGGKRGGGSVDQRMLDMSDQSREPAHT
jgi:hypothetical protein